MQLKETFVLENIQRCGYGKPTPIQAYNMLAVKLGHNVVGVAQTGTSPPLSLSDTRLTSPLGSGKTASDLIPIISD